MMGGIDWSFVGSIAAIVVILVSVVNWLVQRLLAMLQMALVEPNDRERLQRDLGEIRGFTRYCPRIWLNRELTHFFLDYR